MQKFKLLNQDAVELVDKLAAKVTEVSNMKDEQVQELNEAIEVTIANAKKEIHDLANALAEVKQVTIGEITKREISDKVERQISIFDISDKIEAK